MSAPQSRTRIGIAALATAVVTCTALIVTLPAGETVASFVDSHLIRGEFATGQWGIQGNVTADPETGWTDNATESTSANFQPSAGDVVPGATRSYSRFGIRVTPGSDVGATVTLSAGIQVPPSTQADLFRMRVVRSSTCDQTSFVTGAPFIVGEPEVFRTMLSGPETPQDGSIQLSADGTPVYLCYEFSLPAPPPPGLVNGAVATVRWSFDAESMTPQ